MLVIIYMYIFVRFYAEYYLGKEGICCMMNVPFSPPDIGKEEIEAVKEVLESIRVVIEAQERKEGDPS